MGIRRAWAAATLMVIVLFTVAPVGAVRADVPVPPGYRVDARQELVAGVEHVRLVRDRGPLVVHVARIAPGAPVALRPVLSNGVVAGPAPTMERTSEMCRRVACILAVNGDFASLDTGEPIGGLVVAGVMMRSPRGDHHQLSTAKDGRLGAGVLDWSGRLVPTDLRELKLNGVNVGLGADQLVLYTPEWGPTTTANSGADLVLRVLDPPPPVRLGQTALVELSELRDGQGATPVPAGAAVLSGIGAGAQALRDLWGRVQAGAAGRRALLRLEVGADAVDSIGGTPVLVKDGKRWVGNDGSGFVAGRHPRTMVGWNPAGEVLLVTVDGRQPGYSVGLSLPDAADLMLALGATEALNLDGGGSTTFVRQGVVVNTPSDRLVARGGREVIAHLPGSRDRVLGTVERPVGSALTLVPKVSLEIPAIDPLAGAGPGLPQALALPPPAADAASRRDAGMPALVSRVGDSGLPFLPLALAIFGNGALVIVLTRRFRREGWALVWPAGSGLG